MSANNLLRKVFVEEKKVGYGWFRMSNLWQQSMYDHMFAESTLNSQNLRDKAKQEVDFLVSCLSLPDGANVLDVPCGTGRHAKIFAKKLVLNLVNRDFLLSIYRPAFWFKSGSVLTIHASNYDPQTYYNESYMTLKNEDTGETTLSYHRIRLYSAEEIVGLLKRHGLKNVQLIGDFNGSEFDKLKSTHPFFIGTNA